MNTIRETTAILDQLARGPAIIRELIHEMPVDLRKRRPAPGVWSAHEHAVHLPVVQPIMMARLDQMLAHPGCLIKSYEPSRDELADDLLARDLGAEMNRFASDRAVILERLRTLTPEQWAITAEHEEYAQYSVYTMFRHLGLHDLHHAYKIEDRLLRKNWD